MPEKNSRQLISIVTPTYNEEKNVPLLFEQVKEEFVHYLPQYDWELIFVDDGSRDGSWREIAQLAASDPHAKGLSFSRNFTHPNALQAGLEYAKGDAVVMMDADLQHPPAMIKDLVKKWEEGYDIVNTVREATEGASLFKRLTSSLFYRLLNSLSALEIHEGEADFRLLDRRVADEINRLPEKPKFFRGLVNWVGFRKYLLPYKAVSRRFGSSSFTFRKMAELARIGLTSFSMRPLKVIIGVGLLVAIFSFLSLLGVTYLKIVDYNSVSNVVVGVLVILLGIGMIITSQGIIALYLVDIVATSRSRPAYIVAEKVGFSNDSHLSH